MTNNNTDGCVLVRFFSRLGLGFFLIFAMIFMAVASRGGIGFLIDPIPRWIDFALIFAWVTIIGGLAFATNLTKTFFFDKIACRVMFAFFLFWLTLVTIHADQIAQTYAYLNENALYLWSPEYTMAFPCSFLFMEDTYTWSLCLEGALLVNPILTKFVLFCLYWPLIFLLEGVTFWSFLFFVFRAITRVFRRIFFRKAICPTFVPAVEENAAEENGSSVTAPIKKPCFEGVRISFFTSLALVFLMIVALFWGYFLTTHIRRARVWHQDFVSVRMILSRFYHQNGRLPQTWDEIVEAPDKLPIRDRAGKGLSDKEHYFRNLNLSWRAQLNFDHLRKIDEGVDPNSDWIFRVAPLDKRNPTGETEPFLWEQWQINLVNIISRDRFMRSLPSDPLVENPAAPVTAPENSAL